MAKIAKLMLRLFMVCVNGVIPNLKLNTALANLHASSPLYHSKESIVSWAPQAGSMLRGQASKFRSIASDDIAATKCLKQAWGLQAYEK